MARAGTTSVEIDALLLLRRGPIGLFAIQALHKLHRRDVSRIAQKLSRKGWARIEADPEDRRARRLVLTPKGKGLADVLSCDCWSGLGKVNVTVPAELLIGLVQSLAYRRVTERIAEHEVELLDCLLTQSPPPKNDRRVNAQAG